MPTKKPLKKAKRTNWKALASHRQEALTVMAGVNRAQQQKLGEVASELRGELARATFYETQCEAVANIRRELEAKLEAVEKHNAILLADAEKWFFVGETLTEQDKRDLWAWWKTRQKPELFHVEQKAKAEDGEERCPWPNTCPLCLWQRLKAWVWG